MFCIEKSNLTMEGVIQNDQYFNIGRLCNLEKADVFSYRCRSTVEY